MRGAGVDTRPVHEEGAAALPGLVWGYRFNEDGKADPLHAAEALSAFERRESWIWLHFDLVDNRSLKAINSLAGIPLQIREILTGRETRQRIVIVDQHIAGVVRDFEHGDALDTRRMATWRFCMAPHAFVSARHSPLHTIYQVHSELRSGRKFPGVLQLFDTIVFGFAAALSAVTRKLEERLDAIEDSLLSESEQNDFRSVGSTRRHAVRLHRQTAPLRSMLQQLNRERPPWFTEEAARDCEEAAHQVESVDADLVALQQRAHALQDELNSHQTSTINRRLMLLSVISAVLLPPTLITGIFGMNVDGLPLKDESPYGFLLAMGMLVASSVGASGGLATEKIYLISASGTMPRR